MRITGQSINLSCRGKKEVYIKLLHCCIRANFIRDRKGLYSTQLHYGVDLISFNKIELVMGYLYIFSINALYVINR